MFDVYNYWIDARGLKQICQLTWPRIRVKIDGELGGSTPLEQWSTPLEKCQNGAGGSVLGNFQLNNSLTHSNFRYFTFSGKNIKIRPPLEKFDPPWKKSLIFTLPRMSGAFTL